MQTGEGLLEEYEQIQKLERAAEYLMLGLRTTRGVSAQEYQRVYRGSVGMMVNTLADGRGLTQADIDELTAILEKARRERT